MAGLPSDRSPPGFTEPSWTPGAAAKLLGIPPSTLRSWHRRYRLPVAGGGQGRHRRYSTADLAALTRMRQLVADGMSVASAAQRVVTAADPLPGELVAAALRLDADAIATILEAGISRYGVAFAWDQWCRPALTGLGGHTTEPAGEHVKDRVDVIHLLSWVIAAELHRVRSATPASPARKPVLLACMPGERHTLPLEALRAALAEHETPVHYFGADVPIPALRQALHRSTEPASALVLWTHRPNALPAIIADTCAARGTRLHLAGPGWTSPPSTGTDILTSITHALPFLAAM